MSDKILNREYSNNKRAAENSIKLSFMVFLLYLIYYCIIFVLTYAGKNTDTSILFIIQFLITLIFVLILIVLIDIGLSEYKQSVKEALLLKDNKRQKIIIELIKKEYSLTKCVYRTNLYFYIILSVLSYVPLIMNIDYETHFLIIAPIIVLITLVFSSCAKLLRLKSRFGRNITKGTYISMIKLKQKSETGYIKKKGKKLFVNSNKYLCFLGYFGEIVIRSTRENEGYPIFISGDNIEFIKAGDKKFFFSTDKVEWLEK